MTTITLPRATVEQALEILESDFTTEDGVFCRWCDSRFNADHHCHLEQVIENLRAALAQQRLTDAQQEMERSIESLKAALAQQVEPVEPVEPVAWVLDGTDAVEFDRQTYHNGPEWTPLCKCADTPPQRKPLTIERLRDALVASRIIPPAAVEDPDGYDDGVTLFRIEALHRRLT